MADLNDLTTDVNIWNDDKTKAVTVTTDGAKQRLDVEIQDDATISITNDESLTKFQLKTNYNATGTSVASSPDTTLYTFSGAGVIDLVAINSSVSSAWGVDIFVDGTSRFRITMAALGSTLGLTSVGFDVVAETANKEFRWHPQQIGFTTSFTIKAFATNSTVTLNHLIMFREKQV